MAIAITNEAPKPPRFETEADEARRWDENRELVENNLIGAMQSGTVERGRLKG